MIAFNCGDNIACYFTSRPLFTRNGTFRLFLSVLILLGQLHQYTLVLHERDSPPGRSRMLDTEYVCTLTSTDLKKAKDELNEDPKQRLGAVQSLREWVQREPWINAPTDNRFLLPFLRWAKFSQLDARERLTNFCESLTDPRTYGVLKGHDPGDQQSLEIFRHGVYAMLPGTDKNGNAVLFGRPGATDIDNFCLVDYQKAIAPLIHSALFFSEEMQVNGLITTIDFQGVSMKHIPWIGTDRVRKSAKTFGAASPCRIQSVISFNTGAVFETAYSIVSPFLNEKVRNRMQVHHNLVKMYDMVDMSIIPSEYLPDDYDGPTAGSVDDIIEYNIQEYLLKPERREYLKEIYSGKYGADRRNKPTGIESAASYRKLNI